MTSFNKSHMPTYTAEQVSTLSDEEIMGKIEQDDDFAKYLDELQLEIYRDDTLAEVRGALMGEAIKLSDVDCEWRKEWTDEDRKKHRESAYPLAFDQARIVDIRVRILAQVRCAIKRQFPSVTDLSFVQGKRAGLQNVIKRTKDGDLAYRYRDTNRDGGSYLAGKDTIDAIFNWKPHFSPELQMKLVKEFNPEDIFSLEIAIITALAEWGNPSDLTVESWKILLEKDHVLTYKAIWHTRDNRPEVIQMIMANEKFALLFRAKTDTAAQQQLLERAADYPRVNIGMWIANANWADSIRKD